MGVKAKKNKGICKLTIDEELTIYSAARLKDELLGHLSSCAEVELNLEEVSEMDSAGLQVLLMLKKEAVRVNKEVSFVKHSQAVVEIIELLNLAAHFGDAMVLPASWKTS